MNILFSLFLAVSLQDYPDHVGVVNDFANELDPGTKGKIEQVIADVKAKVDVRLVVVTVPSLGGKTVEDYTIGLTKKWGVGQKGKNNGILFLHAPKEHKIRIENGYGVESRLTDVESKMIIEDTIVPLMKNKKFAEAMLRGSEEILKVLSAPEKQPEKQAAPIARAAKDDGIGAGAYLLIFGVVAVIGIVIFVAVMSSRVEQPRRVATWTSTPATSRPIEPPPIYPMGGLATGAVLGAGLGSQLPHTPPAPQAPQDPSMAAAFLAEQEERRRRRKKQEEEEEEERSRRRRSYSSSDDSSSSSSSSSWDSGSSSSSDSFSGGDSGGGGASGDY